MTCAPGDTVGADTVTVELVRDGRPGVTVTVGRAEVTASPPIVAPMLVAVPAVWPVKGAV